MDKFLECSCGEVLIKSYGDVVKVRNKVLVFKNGDAYAVCKGCGHEHQIPVKLVQGIAVKDRQPKLYLRKR